VVDVVVLELSGVYGSCGGAWKMWWCKGDVVVHRRCNVHGWCVVAHLRSEGVLEKRWHITSVVVHARFGGAL
jgi:hypothetical protein